jgi:hypothetical protein
VCFLGQLKVVLGQHLASLCKTLLGATLSCLGTMLGVVLHFPLGQLGAVSRIALCCLETSHNVVSWDAWGQPTVVSEYGIFP